MCLAEFRGDVLDLLCDLQGFTHDLHKTGPFGADNQSKLNVVFLLFVFVLDEEADGGGLLCEDGGKYCQEGNEDM